MKVRLIKHGNKEVESKDRPVDPRQLKLKAQSWVNEFRERRLSVGALTAGKRHAPQLSR
ncbi:MAG TPA: hypothetical protein VNO14_00195 [Blastocatellia bacterium]|nr:hypothetical protein [Blastocatellia bacterium]